MRLRVVHATTFTYDGPATRSYNQARLTPSTTPEQIVVHRRLDVSPTPWTSEYRDYFGSEVVAFEVVDPHDGMKVTATSTVQVTRPPSTAPSVGWDGLRSAEVADRFTEHLVLPDLVAPPADLAERVRALGEAAGSPTEAALEVCRLVHGEMAFVPGSTDVGSTAAGAWEQRSGVCQDMVHVTLGALRSLGVPARYVSGYFHPSDDPVVGETVPGESHAWVQWWDGEWRAHDPTNDAEPGDRWVTVATGRDYRDVRPISGVYSGARTTDMDVEVTLTRLG